MKIPGRDRGCSVNALALYFARDTSGGTVQLVSHSPAQSRELGLALGAQLQPGDVVCLAGSLGAGKTWLAAAMGIGWGALQPLTSPTFTLIHEHRRARDDCTLFHVDCYRLRNAGEATQAGIEEALAGYGPALIEWPERIVEVLPAERLWISLDILGPERRRLQLQAVGARHELLLSVLLKQQSQP